MSVKSISFDDHNRWQWKEHSAGDLEPPFADDQKQQPWRSARSFPSEIHVELLANGLIPDPFLGANEHKVQWVGEREWLYRYSFDYEETNVSSSARQELRFEGLDTLCDVYLNNKKILEANNMFRTYTVDLASHGPLKNVDNVLLLHFKSAKLSAKEIERARGTVRAGSTNLGDPSRVYVRKAQYDWRWDWGPELMTCGPYRPITLVTYAARLSNVYTRATVSEELKASFSVEFDVIGLRSSVHSARCILRRCGAQAPVLDENLGAGISQGGDISKWSRTYSLDETIELWWPVGYGSQTLYEAEVILLGESGNVIDVVKKKVGFRRVKLIQEPLAEADQYGKGTTFLFEVNGVRMFMGGSNWIPADNFLTRVTEEKYRAWLTLLRDGNQNMVRIWGGGIYEPDIFYDVCDELGILVWQDFGFACGVYPAYPQFIENVKAEAEDNVKRLRHHPSLAIFCGNNEDYQQVLQWGDVEDLPARILYEKVLPETVAVLTHADIPYHFGSPYGGKGWDTADPTVGDVHQWDIWGGKERPWQYYGVMGGRFVSEFGIPAMPDIRTIDYWLDGNTKDRWPQSKLMAQHCRAGAFERRFAIVMNENFRFTTNLERYAYQQQIMQSEAVGYAYRAWRREWRGKGKEYCAGALVWQMNDCWPVTSWSLVDYFLRPKAAYYTVARELRPIVVGITRTVQKNRDNDRPPQFYEFGAYQSVGATIEVWGANSTLQARAAHLELRCFDLESTWTHTETHQVLLLPNQSTELLKIACPGPPANPPNDRNDVAPTTSYSVVVGARLLDAASGNVIARYADWPQPYRHVEFPEPGLVLTVGRNASGDKSRISLSVTKPVKGLVLSADGDGNVVWSDNALDVLPGDEQTVIATELGGRNVRATYMTCEV